MENQVKIAVPSTDEKRFSIPEARTTKDNGLPKTLWIIRNLADNSSRMSTKGENFPLWLKEKDKKNIQKVLEQGPKIAHIVGVGENSHYQRIFNEGHYFQGSIPQLQLQYEKMSPFREFIFEITGK